MPGNSGGYKLPDRMPFDPWREEQICKIREGLEKGEKKQAKGLTEKRVRERAKNKAEAEAWERGEGARLARLERGEEVDLGNMGKARKENGTGNDNNKKLEAA